MALSVEVSELMEHFQWLTESQSELEPNSDTHQAVSEEMADVLIYLLQLSDRLNIDIAQAANAKMTKNALKYPVEKFKGSSDKYDKK
ncbi:nucleotide pyrophosphohydrolase [Shewanella marina]|uniref:nucleotide pyrophosphohydrolase n=1 Tax=Shewanella marina TaxID=487319 RepID=UPI00046F69A1|nr:nucleotide pyrophosphohydrolase [Shewanella marina]